ncbi:hypothetical protein ACHAQA_003213 [Verticillium albo-atrum]
MNTYPDEDPARTCPLLFIHPTLQAGMDPGMTPGTWVMPATVTTELSPAAAPTSAPATETDPSSAEEFESVDETESETDEDDVRNASPAGEAQDDGDWHVVSDAAGPDPDRTVATLLNMLASLERQARGLEGRRRELLERRGEVERELLRTEPWVLAREITGEEVFWWERREGKGGSGVRELREIEDELERGEKGMELVEGKKTRIVRLLVGVWGGGV